MTEENEHIKISVIEEQVSISKAVLTTGSLHVTKKVDDIKETWSTVVASETYDIERVPKNVTLEQAPEPVQRYHDRIVIPVLEERLVTEKKLVLVEEIHLIRKENRKEEKGEINLKKETVTVERKKPL